MPQPIDVQTELARVTTMERVQQISDRLSLAAHQRMSDQADKQQVNAETQTKQAEQKSDQVERDLKRRSPYGRRKQRDASAQETEESAKPAPMPPAAREEHKLDISI